MNIEIELIDKYFFHNDNKILLNNENNMSRSKIINHCYYAINEANISSKIKQIPYYSNFFSILEDFKSLNVSQLNEDMIEKLKNIENVMYYLFKYNDKRSLTIIDFIYSSTNIKKLIFDMINTFKHVLRSLYILNENDICFFNISPNNIIFLATYREKPVLNNFQLSLQLDKLEYKYFSQILDKIEDFTYMPLEIHTLFYIIKHNMITLSYSFIEELSEYYVNNLHILKLFSENYRQSYKLQCVEFLKRYINIPIKNIINDLFERNNNWDVFGISMLYIQIFGSISRVFSLKGICISKITVELSRNLHPNSDKRYTLNETLNIFNKLLNEQDDWSFVNNLDNNKLTRLFDDFSA